MNKLFKLKKQFLTETNPYQNISNSKELNDLFYNKYFDLFYNSGFQGLGSKYFHKSIEANWENMYPKRVLEIGAMGGHHFKYMKLSNPSSVVYIASDIRRTDIDSETIELRNGSVKVKWVRDDICNSNFSNMKFDRIVSTCVFAHVENPVDAVYELRRILNLGGEIAIGLPTDPGFLNRLIKQCYSYPRITRRGFPKVKLYNAISHKNSIFSLRYIFDEVFQNDYTTWNFYPFGIPSFDLNLFAVFRAKRIG